MNKLIIAGNGFDLAHGLPTSYNHFMDAFWRDLGKDYEVELIKEIVYVDSEFLKYFRIAHIKNFNDFNEIKEKFISSLYKPQRTFEFKNQFFKDLNKVQSVKNWVDVENEYYQKLKELCLYEDDETKANKTIYKEVRLETVSILHKEFEQVKQLLERYLQKNIVEAYDFEHVSDKCSEIKEILRPFVFNFKNVHEERLFDEFTIAEDQDFILKLYEQYDLDFKNGKKPKLNSGKVVNFNYTSTALGYLRSLVDDYDCAITTENHIHGELNKNIVFGFGDEMDDDYKLIEDMDDNEYLKYFKSFQYVQNSRYKSILRYIDSEKFQVIIMGHSCGLSDRVLLNTIFEHDNCRSIKVFYHQKEDGTNNYTETIQNISRHFNDKKLMRTKIVEKTLCEPMPQIQLPKKKK